MRRIRRFEMLRLPVIFGVLLLAFGPSPALAQASGTWVTTGSMTTLRSYGDASATLLQNGQVLVAGGNNGSTYLASAELHNPATGTWTATGSMTTVRSEGAFTATPLQDGEVLVAGGRTPPPSPSRALSSTTRPPGPSRRPAA